MTISLPDFSQYQTPGVYWSQTSTPTTTASPGVPNGVCIVGPALGYRTSAQTLTITGTSVSPQTITNSSGSAIQGIFLNSLVIPNPNGGNFTAGVDYIASNNYGANGNNPYTVITQIYIPSGSGMTSGTAYSINYAYADTTYFTPTQVSDGSTAAALYGAAFNGSAIQSPLTLAATIAINNGASDVWLMPVPWSGYTYNAGSVPVPNGVITSTALSNAYTTIAANTDISLVVPMPTGIVAEGTIEACAADLSSYLNSQVATNGIFQYGLFGWEANVGIGITSGTSPTDIANYSGVANSRMSVVFPNDLTYNAAGAGNQIVVGGYYLSAALAGLLASNPVQQGLTKQVLGNSFSGIAANVSNIMTTAAKKSWSAGGVLVVEQNRQGGLVVRHGVTSVPSTSSGASVYNREISLVRAQDDMIDTIVQTLDNSGQIGSPINSNTPTVISGIVTTVLAGLTLSGAIESFSGVTTTESSINPTIMNVTFNYVPSYPLNYITVTFGIDTSTGAITSASNSTNGA